MAHTKHRLNELSQKLRWPTPAYEMVKYEVDRGVTRCFVECRCGDQTPVTGSGPRRNVAKVNAAAEMLNWLQQSPEVLAKLDEFAKQRASVVTGKRPKSLPAFNLVDPVGGFVCSTSGHVSFTTGVFF